MIASQNSPDQIAKRNKKLTTLTDHASPGISDIDQKATIYDFYAQRYGIKILALWDHDQEFMVLNISSGSEITGTELDKKINEIMNEITKSQRSIDRVPKDSNGQIISVTTRPYVQPDNQVITELMKMAKIELPLARQVEIAKVNMQIAYKALEGMSELETIEFVTGLQYQLKAANDIVASQYKIRRTKSFAEMDREHRRSQVKADKKSIAISKNKDKPNKPLTEEQIAAKTKANEKAKYHEDLRKRMELAGLVPNLNSGDRPKVNIETTSTKETSYGS